MKARSAKRKGSKLEREIAALFGTLGWKARKQPGSGIYQDFPHDVFAEHPTRGTFVLECKARKAGIATIQRWLGKADILVIRPDRAEPYVVMPWRAFAALASENNG